LGEDIEKVAAILGELGRMPTASMTREEISPPLSIRAHPLRREG
jgi:hypothetical protein